ncbi:hypothetical protein C8Q79DRAFT_916824 [Trametes meyenii]|nr:hypothetical protein C8Q79DRAFT_916824 [Trametes meyenii]
MPSPLPPEVVEEIIHSIDDRETLCSCALTCRQWLPASRYNLFYRISISRRANFDAFVSVRKAHHIASALRNIHSLQLWEDKERPWLHLFLLIFSTRLPNADFLTFGDFIWDEFPLRPNFHALGTQFCSVTTLKLTDGNFYSFMELRRIVAAFKLLSRLFLVNVAWRVAPAVSRCEPLYRSPHLELLWFSSSCEGAVPALVEWLLNTCSIETLSDVQIWDQHAQYVPVLCSFVQALGPQLEHFQVSLRSWTRDNFLNLSCNTNLRTLHIRDIDAASCPILRLILQDLKTAHLVDLTLYLRISTIADLKKLKDLWKGISAILEGDNFLPLERLMVWVLKVPATCETNVPDLIRELREWMPGLDCRGVLRVSPWMKLEE